MTWMGNPSPFPALVVVVAAAVFLFAGHTSAVDFLFNSFNGSSSLQLQLIRDAHIEGPVIRLTDETSHQSVGRAFFPTPVRMRRPATAGTGNASSSTIASFSTSFVFSILGEIPSSQGFGMAFVISNSTEPPGALPGQYFGLFTNSTVPTIAPLLAVEFDTGWNQELGDPDGSHVGIDFNNVRSAVANSPRFSNTDEFGPLLMWTGMNIRAYIDFDGLSLRINVTVAPADTDRPDRPLVSYSDPAIADYISDQMYVGFSASKVASSGMSWVERQRLLAWSFTDEGRPAREINTSDLPDFQSEYDYYYRSSSFSSSSLSSRVIAGIVVGPAAALALYAAAVFLVWRRFRKADDDDDEAMDLELEYWPHRFAYDELLAATKGFAKEELLGFGGFGKVYKGILPNCSVKESAAIAVKCISHDSKQGLREFMAEISSMGRLRHKNLVPMRGWCRRGNELMLVYDYMPNGSLNRRIFDQAQGPLGWDARLRILADVAQGVDYLHHGWNKIVIHRDIKSSNILLDGEMRGRLGDFGLAKLCEHGQASSSTRLIGTLGYMAPELARRVTPTVASDVYSFGVIVLEVATGRRPIEHGEEEATVLVDVVRNLCAEGRLEEAADLRLPAAAYPAEGMKRVLTLGLRCCHPDPGKRPTKRKVLAILLGEDDGPNAGIFPGLDRRVVVNRPNENENMLDHKIG